MARRRISPAAKAPQPKRPAAAVPETPVQVPEPKVPEPEVPEPEFFTAVKKTYRALLQWRRLTTFGRIRLACLIAVLLWGAVEVTAKYSKPVEARLQMAMIGFGVVDPREYGVNADGSVVEKRYNLEEKDKYWTPVLARVAGPDGIPAVLVERGKTHRLQICGDREDHFQYEVSFNIPAPRPGQHSRWAVRTDRAAKHGYVFDLRLPKSKLDHGTLVASAVTRHLLGVSREKMHEEKVFSHRVIDADTLKVRIRVFHDLVRHEFQLIGGKNELLPTPTVSECLFRDNPHRHGSFAFLPASDDMWFRNFHLTTLSVKHQ